MNKLIILLTCAVVLAQPTFPHIMHGNIEPCEDITHITAILFNTETTEYMQYPPYVYDVFQFDECNFRIQPSVINLEMGDSFSLIITDTVANLGAVITGIIEIIPPVYQNLGVIYLQELGTEGLPLIINECCNTDLDYIIYYFDIRGKRVYNLNNIETGIYLKLLIDKNNNITKNKIIKLR